MPGIRGRLASTLALALLLAGPDGAGAGAGPSAGGLSSGTLTYRGTVPFTGHINGARRVGRHFYVTTGKDLTILDVSDPLAPRTVGYLEFDPIDVHYETGYQEDPDTNGRILLRHGAHELGEALQVVDVSDPARPAVIGTLPGSRQHTVSCVLDCTWAYGSDGEIVDLRDPARPRVAGDWLRPLAKQVDLESAHDVTEVSPGLVLTASDPMMLLDVRSDPAAPTLVAKADAPHFLHGVLWPLAGLDDFILAGGEAGGAACSEEASAVFSTWDARGWDTTATFRRVAEFRLRDGDVQNGSIASARWCTHWFDSHPGFGGGGLVAIAWYEQGTRLLAVSPQGAIEEVGWFMPWAGASWSAHWITDRIVYSGDYRRGIDILEYTGDIPQGRTPPSPAPEREPSPVRPAPARPTSGVSFDDLVRLPRARRCGRASLAIRVLRHRDDPVRKIVARIGRRAHATVRGRRLHEAIRLKRIPRRGFTLTVEVRTRSGHTTAGRRHYRACTSR